ncbi:dihydrolipoamide acetyltransferase family protein [Novibacillus thermophilus]|uniref:Dihydrolipoamide acetyltransferase component of pyruvate dehydrogenase complex n=1 Tax=Novibacillus thermophilus TaxID=1471761 RepID=A0A1U9KC22_9BACL|nr:dihydrolipoamide acetyltransferase family protein [Novibacillus thermophilus]AQS57566.1 branched-chain alpha-keto acid dehydrogenase subunit E2 [Novibacillus thermophilus]
MREKVTMPQLGESVTEGTITTWLKQLGERIQLYEPLCEVTTDKVSAEVPATAAGTLVDIVVEAGSTVAVGDVICTIEKNEDEGGKSVRPKKGAAEGEEGADSKRRYSPAVLRLAQEHDIELGLIEGSGRGGRVTRKDVLAYIEKQKKLTVQSTVTSSAQPDIERKETGAVVQSTGDREIELDPVRRTIAERMVKSKQEIPHAWMMVEADVTGLVRLRERVKDEFLAREGVRLTYLPFFIKAVVESLKQYPRLNAVWAGDKIIEKKEINISVAIAGDDALHVPVIRHADSLSISGIAKALGKLIHKVAAGELSVSDTRGGTFTVNNTGTFGSIASNPIINVPQAAIISMESIVKRPVVVNDAIAIRDMVHFCLSLDHRILDGALAGKFMQSVKHQMESFGDETPLY